MSSTSGFVGDDMWWKNNQSIDNTETTTTHSTVPLANVWNHFPVPCTIQTKRNIPNPNHKVLNMDKT